MATSDQIKSLIRSHFYGEPGSFDTIALQIADHEVEIGHTSLAYDIRDIVDMGRKKSVLRVLPFYKDLKGLTVTEKPETSKQDLVVSDEIQERIDQVIYECHHHGKLKSYKMCHRRKILLIGHPGTGKTMTAKVLARELKLPLHTIQFDRLVTRSMGETSANLRQIFDFMQGNLGVYFFDEFDAIGGERSMDNDLGETRRVVNSFLQFIEQDSSESIIIAATNNEQLLDRALFRRFDDVIYYKNPTDKEKKQLISNKLGNFKPLDFKWRNVLEKSAGLSHSDLVLACNDAIKAAILSDKKKVTSSDLHAMISRRQNAIGILNPKDVTSTTQSSTK